MYQSAKDDNAMWVKILKDSVRVSDRVTVIASVKHVSRSGMSREITFHTISKTHGTLYCLDGLIAGVLGMKPGREGVKVHGCGMDMVFYTLNCLDRELSGDGGHSTVSPGSRAGYGFHIQNI